MNYEDSLEFIHGVSWKGMKLGHTRIQNLLKEVGSPDEKLKFIHIAGTNGKGSTSSMLRYILMEAGYRVGLFISPYIDIFNERIQVGTNNISNDELAEITTVVKLAIDRLVKRGLEHPTEFEIVTVIGFLHFVKSNCDIVVMEVGLGGRLDATNVIKKPEVSVITTISYDHMDLLGDTLEKIAMEKAGIIKNNCPVVLYEQKPSVESVFANVANEKNSYLYKVDFSLVQSINFNEYYQTFDFGKYKNIELGLLGSFQTYNAATVIKAAEVLQKNNWKITTKNIMDGLKKAKWTGRFEILNHNPITIVDGGHNPQCAKMLTENLNNYFPNKKVTFVIGVMKDKDYAKVIKEILPIAYRIITVTPDYYRALPSEQLWEYIKQYHHNTICSSTISEGVKEAKKLATNEELICVFGSLYMAGEARRSINE